MQPDFKIGFNTFFDERIGGLLVNLHKINPQYHVLSQRVKDQTEKLKDTIEEQAWEETKKLLKNLKLQSDIEQQYLFAQGLTDCAILLAYLQGEILERNFIDKGNDE